jgi:alcohol dehydrogenase (NADP+)
MGYPDTFEGYAVKSKEKWSDFHRISYKPKRFEDYDIDIEITHCGVCASDLHTINGGWGDADYPIVAGHEIVGKALKVGPKVKSIKVGDRVGVGAQVWSCLDCRIVSSPLEIVLMSV